MLRGLYLKNNTIIFLLLVVLPFLAKSKNYTGVILSLKDSLPVAYANIHIESLKENVAANEKGEFIIRTNQTRPTITISVVGYYKQIITLKVTHTRIYLQTKTIKLPQARVSPQGALEYIKRVNKYVKTNYPSEMKSEKLIVNKTILKENGNLALNQAFLIQASIVNQGLKIPYADLRLLDYYANDNGYRMAFMQKQKHKSKAKKQLNKYNLLDDDEENTELSNRERLINKLHRMIVFGRFTGGVLSYAPHFLNPNYYYKYEYSQKKDCNDSGVMQVMAKLKRRYKGMYIEAIIDINCDNYALENIRYRVEFKPPFYIKAAFLATGYYLKYVDMIKKIQFRKHKAFWDVYSEEHDIKFRVKKKSFFRTQYNSTFSIFSKSVYLENKKGKHIDYYSRMNIADTDFGSQVKKISGKNLKTYIDKYQLELVKTISR